MTLPEMTGINNPPESLTQVQILDPTKMTNRNWANTAYFPLNSTSIKDSRSISDLVTTTKCYRFTLLVSRFLFSTLSFSWRFTGIPLAFF